MPTMPAFLIFSMISFESKSYTKSVDPQSIEPTEDPFYTEYHNLGFTDDEIEDMLEDLYKIRK